MPRTKTFEDKIIEATAKQLIATIKKTIKGIAQGF